MSCDKNVSVGRENCTNFNFAPILLLLCLPDSPLGLVGVLQYDDLATADLQRGLWQEGAPADAGRATAAFADAAAPFGQFLRLVHPKVRRIDLGEATVCHDSLRTACSPNLKLGSI